MPASHQLSSIALDVYGKTVEVCIAFDPDRAWAAMRKRFEIPEEHDPLARGDSFTMTTPSGDVLVFLAYEQTCPEVVAHECFHALAAVFDHVGVGYSPEHQEVWAYPLGMLVGKVVDALKRAGGRKP